MHTLDEILLARFEESLVRTGLAVRTVVNYMADLRCFARWLADQPSPDGGLLGVRVEDVQRYQARMCEKGQAPSTINRRVHTIRKFYELAMTDGWVATNPACHVRSLPRTVLASPRALTDAEAGALLHAIRSVARSSLLDRDYAIMLLLLGTGVRVSELVELQLEDVEFLEEGGYVLVGQRRMDGGRYVPLSPWVCEGLKRYLQVRPRALTVHYLFLSQGGYPLSPRTVQGLVQNYSRAAGLKGVTPRVLRDTFALAMLEATEDVSLVAALLGHRRVKTTVERYLNNELGDPLQVQRHAEG